jgi:hypothetical protein
VVTSGYPVKFPTLFFENLDYLFTVHTRKVYQIRYIVNQPEQKATFSRDRSWSETTLLLQLTP